MSLFSARNLPTGPNYTITTCHTPLCMCYGRLFKLTNESTLRLQNYKQSVFQTYPRRCQYSTLFHYPVSWNHNQLYNQRPRFTLYTLTPSSAWLNLYSFPCGWIMNQVTLYNYIPHKSLKSLRQFPDILVPHPSLVTSPSWTIFFPLAKDNKNSTFKLYMYFTSGLIGLAYVHARLTCVF